MSRNQLSRKLDDLRQMMASSYSADVGEGGRGERGGRKGEDRRGGKHSRKKNTNEQLRGDCE